MLKMFVVALAISLLAACGMEQAETPATPRPTAVPATVTPVPPTATPHIITNRSTDRGRVVRCGPNVPEGMPCREQGGWNDHPISPEEWRIKRHYCQEVSKLDVCQKKNRLNRIYAKCERDSGNWMEDMACRRAADRACVPRVGVDICTDDFEQSGRRKRPPELPWRRSNNGGS